VDHLEVARERVGQRGLGFLGGLLGGGARRGSRRGRGLGVGDQAQHALGGLAAGARVIAIEPVQARARVGVDHRQRGLLFEHVIERGDQHQVLEHVGVIAGMEGVAVAEHEKKYLKGGGMHPAGSLDSRAGNIN
jgi:hypothetical protein